MKSILKYIGILAIIIFSSGCDNKSKSPDYEVKSTYSQDIEQPLVESHQASPAYSSTTKTISDEPVKQDASSPSKWYQLGYRKGYDDGIDDAELKNGYNKDYEGSIKLQGKEKKDFEEGYSDGYDDGYEDGKSSNNDDDEEDE